MITIHNDNLKVSHDGQVVHREKSLDIQVGHFSKDYWLYTLEDSAMDPVIVPEVLDKIQSIYPDFFKSDNKAAGSVSFNF